MDQRFVLEHRREHLPRGEKIVIAFSGGPDSLCLAAIAARMRRSMAIEPLLVHVNHHLRPSSDADALAAARAAEKLDLPFECVELSRSLGTLHPGVGIEEAARRERYLALARAARSWSTDIVATGHHRGDQAETVLLHLLRGSGSQGATGMSSLAVVPVPWWSTSDIEPIGIRVWRPLLRESRTDIEAYVAGRGLTPLVDESNSSIEFTRNLIRHELLPSIERAFPRATEAFARFAEIAADEHQAIDDLATEALFAARIHDDVLDPGALRDRPRAIQRRALLRWLREATGSSEITFERVEAVRELIMRPRRGARIEVGAGYDVSLSDGRLTAARSSTT